MIRAWKAVKDSRGPSLPSMAEVEVGIDPFSRNSPENVFLSNKEQQNQIRTTPSHNLTKKSRAWNQNGKPGGGEGLPELRCGGKRERLITAEILWGVWHVDGLPHLLRGSRPPHPLRAQPQPRLQIHSSRFRRAWTNPRRSRWTVNRGGKRRSADRDAIGSWFSGRSFGRNPNPRSFPRVKPYKSCPGEEGGSRYSWKNTQPKCVRESESESVGESKRPT